jgi:rhodanese-related sulfurtransferase
MKQTIIDVRERDEFDSEHIPNSINVPFSAFSSMVPGVISNLQGKEIVLMCLSGKRSALALNQIKQLGLEGAIRVYKGGLKDWKNAGNVTTAKNSKHLPILRQVHLGAGLLVVGSVVLGHFLNPFFYLLTGFVGAGLTFAGITGTCLMGELLAKMPWNNTTNSLKQEVCVAGTGTTTCFS